jgi:hypothetical protein
MTKTVILMYVHGTFVPKNFTVTHFTSLQYKITSHKSCQFTPSHYTSHHITYLHSIPTCFPLLVTTFLTLFLNVFNLQGKDASKPAGNWFQFLTLRFTKVYLPTWSKRGKEYPTDNKQTEGWLVWSHLALKLAYKTCYWRKDRGKDRSYRNTRKNM